MKYPVIILAGGKGKRIKKLTAKKPKPLVKILNKPFKYNNEWILCRLEEYKESRLDQKTVMNLKSKILDEEIEREIINCYTNDLNTLLN